MPVRAGVCLAFLEAILRGNGPQVTDQFKLAIYTPQADLSPQTAAYTTAGEVTATGYPPGGIALTGATVGRDRGTVFLDFADAWLPAATYEAAGGLIYNATRNNLAVAVIRFGDQPLQVQGQAVPILFPPPTAETAVIRLRGVSDGADH